VCEHPTSGDELRPHNLILDVFKELIFLLILRVCGQKNVSQIIKILSIGAFPHVGCWTGARNDGIQKTGKKWATGQKDGPINFWPIIKSKTPFKEGYSRNARMFCFQK